METPSPDWGIFRWAWHQAKKTRARFWIGAGVFTLIAAVIVSRVPLPSNPTPAQNLLATVIAILGAIVATSVGTYACALLAAPCQQRNELRKRLAASAKLIKSLRSAPVSREHGDKLREVAKRLRECVEGHEALDYGPDPDIWFRSLNEHFPELLEVLIKTRVAFFAFEALKRRLYHELHTIGMIGPPWCSLEDWLPTTLQARSLQGILGGGFIFDWREGSGNLHLGDQPVVLLADNPAELPACKQAFEEFFKRAETWPETTVLREKWDEQHAAEGKATKQLSTVANTDPIITRCFLCRDS